MKEEEDDLYRMALGENYALSSTKLAITSTSNIEMQIVGQAPSSTASDDVPGHAALFRQLLVGSRSQIDKLKAENNELRTNLENAIASGGVVICPNCTHHFKDRQSSMKPRAMKKMRARNCVELEFNNQEDLETWLYLNQLETNNDGMPTVMNVKKATNATEKSLKDVGSLLPHLMEKKKVELEKQKGLLKEEKQEMSFNKTSERKNSFDRKNEKNDSRRSRKHSLDDRDQRKDDNRNKDKRKERPTSIYSRENVSPASVKTKKENIEKNEKQEKEYRRKEKDRISQHEDSKKLEATKRKLPLTENDERQKKILKKPISQRIQFPESRNEISDEIQQSPDIPRRVLKLESQTVNTSKSFLFPPLSSEPISKIENRSKRETIVWDPTPKQSESDTPEAKNRNPFEFKVKMIEKKKSDVSKTKITKPVIDVAKPPELPKTKYKFVPTSKKNNSKISNSEESSSSRHPVENTPTTSSEDRSAPLPFIKECSVLKDDNLETSKEIGWKKYSVKKTAGVLDHIYKRALERQTARRNWPEKMIVLNGDVLQENESSDLTSHRSIPRASSSTNSHTSDQMKMDFTINMERENISNSLKRIGLSAEGIAVLAKQFNYTSKSAEETSTVNITTSGDLPSCSVEIDNTKCIDVSNSNHQEQEYFHSPSSFVVNPAFDPSSIPGTSEFGFPKNQNFANFEDDDNDAFEEFFPDLANTKFKQAPAEIVVTNVEQSNRPISTGSFGSMADREEDELTCLIREDSTVPPSGDYLINIEDAECEMTIIPPEDGEKEENARHQPQETTSDWKEFCLEDVEDDIDEATRERKLSEMEKSENNEVSMDWLDNLEQLEPADDDEIEVEPQNETKNFAEEVILDEKQLDTHRSESVPLDMNSEFRLSDEEDLISPMTSTPRPEDSLEDVTEGLEDGEVDLNLPVRDESFIDELDWNYDMDNDEEEEEQNEEDRTGDTVIETIDRERTHDTDKVAENNPLEDGEISEDGEVKEEHKKTEIKKPIKERIRYVVEENQICGVDNNEDDDEKNGYRHSISDNKRTYRSSNRRRSSEENRDRSYKRDSRPATYRSLLKRRNS